MISNYNKNYNYNNNHKHNYKHNYNYKHNCNSNLNYSGSAMRFVIPARGAYFAKQCRVWLNNGHIESGGKRP